MAMSIRLLLLSAFTDRLLEIMKKNNMLLFIRIHYDKDRRQSILIFFSASAQVTVASGKRANVHINVRKKLI